jgi:hypothetical protein
MSTASLLDLLEVDLPSGWSRSTGSRSLLKAIEKGQDKLFKALSRKRRYIGLDNMGFEPYLKTIDGTYEYEIIAANLSCGALTQKIAGTDYEVPADIVLEIFIDASLSIAYDMSHIGEPCFYGEINPYYMGTERIYMRRVPVDSSPGLENTPPRVRFKDDPGTTTDQYFCGFLWLPPRLISESIPLAIPEDFEDAIEAYVRARMQTSQSGAESEFMNSFMNYWIPKFTREYRRSASAGPKFTEPNYW